ncbi:glycosyltransferase family 2 protein [Flavobacterium sp.]|uniref:glycosyltransferase family 2 protein n=1 Tax=Flavobacterium sp. TaxID=239 RepID=UPI0026112A9E|nr:glycosyltransferase family 2 protein [Flavobacterium sp.]
MKLVSIIIPCYNQSKFLPETLESVLKQTYTNWECIIVNDGSPDNTEEVAQQWCKKDERFIYLKKENGGLSSARNAGLKIAQGDYIQFLDSDDLLEKDKIKWQSQFFDKEIDVLISGYRYFENSEGITKLRIIGNNSILPETAIIMSDHVDVINVFKRRNPFVICAPLYKKRVFEVIGKFDEQLHSLEDWDFHLRCALKKMIFHHSGYADNSKVLVRLHNNSMTKDPNTMRANYLKFVEKCNQNPEFVAYFGVSEIDENSLIHKIKLAFHMWLPPVVFILKGKIIKLIKSK